MLIKQSLCILLFCLLLSGFVQGQISETKAIEYVKQLSPSSLDSSLPSGHFSDWLTEILGNDAAVEWGLDDCGEQSGNPALDKGRDLPVCVGVYSDLTDGRWLGISILIGTLNRGISGPSVVYDIFLVEPRQTTTINRLSDIQKTIIQSSRW